MKSRIHNILLLVVALFTICSCSKPSKETFVSTLTITTMEGAPMDGASIVLSNEGEQYSFVIKSNTEWIIGCNADWVKLSTATGRGNSEVT
ncbi:MAG: BACON domain-containing protein, partial [Alistipes sp.]|nr:BACON domain-containing protein [Alistipes sp.]